MLSTIPRNPEKWSSSRRNQWTPSIGMGGQHRLEWVVKMARNTHSIAWLAHQMIGLRKDGQPVFDSIVVVTDRRILDRQIRDTIKQFAQVGATVGHAEQS